MNSKGLNKNFLEISCCCNEQDYETISCDLFELGFSGLVEEEFQNEPGKLYFTAYYEKQIDCSIEEWIGNLKNNMQNLEIISFTGRAYENWMENWKVNFRRVPVSPTLHICPSWEEPMDGINEVVIHPGMAFGTGNHESTKLALLLLEKHCRLLEGNTFYEVGIGSGILSIAAIKLGMIFRGGCDIAPESLPEVTENFRLNGLLSPHNVSQSFFDLNTNTENAKLLIANMTAQELIEVKKALLSHMNKDSILIMSGVFSVSQKEFSNEFSPFLKIIDSVEEKGWTAYLTSFKN